VSRRTLLILALICLPAGARRAHAETARADAETSRYSRRVWQTRDGLPEETVQAFAQTPDHYLWIGTSGGLVRFDGEQLVVFNRESTPAFHDNSVFCLATARDGSLWIGTDGSGVLHYKDRVFRAYTARDGLANGFVRALFEDHAGVIWAGTDNGLYRLRNDRMERVDGVNGVPALAVHAIREDRRGRLWVGGSTLVLLDGGAAYEYRLPGEASANRIKSILAASDGTVWVGTVSGVQLSRGERDGRPAEFVKRRGVAGTVRVLREDGAGTIWMGTIGGGILRWRDGRMSRMSAPQVLPSNAVLSLFEDSEANLWVGTQTGMLRLSRTALSMVPLAATADSDFSTVSQDPDGRLWIASTFLYRFDGQRAVPFQFPGELAHLHVRNVLKARDGAYWVGTDGHGLFRLRNGAATHYTTARGLINNFIRAVLEARDGSLWIGTDEGLSHWHDGGFTNYEVRDGLSYFSIRALLEDRNGDVWIGTERGVSRIRNGRFVSDAVSERLRNEKVWALHEDVSGGLWIGTRGGGLFRWKQGRLDVLTTARGLASNSIYHILETKDGTFWMSGPNGISSVSRADLDRLAGDPSFAPAVTLYGVSDGMATTQMHGGTQPAGCLSASGEIWFPSNKGPVRILPEEAVMRRGAPPTVIESVVADGHAVNPQETLELPPGAGKLEVHYGAVRLSSQERVRFRYKLEGFDPDWTDAAARRVAYYTNLPPGPYRFRVVAFDMSAPSRTAEASLAINWHPHFYRRAWFLLAVLAGLLAAALAAYRLHLGNIRAKFRAVLDERGRLAREMHDTLIQGCTGVSALLEAASSVRESAPESHQELIEQARLQVHRTIEEARRAVWNLRQSTSRQGLLGAKLTQLARSAAANTEVAVHCEMQPDEPDMAPEVEEDCLLAAREAIHNALRHAHARNLHVRLWFRRQHAHLLVADDGAGFDERAIAQGTLHYGLVGMRERIERRGGRFELSTAPGEGTRIEIDVGVRGRTEKGVAAQ
jgi:ligand-binding sensor domain-containing protein/signal transduction histidine kinase